MNRNQNNLHKNNTNTRSIILSAFGFTHFSAKIGVNFNGILPGIPYILSHSCALCLSLNRSISLCVCLLLLFLSFAQVQRLAAERNLNIVLNACSLWTSQVRNGQAETRWWKEMRSLTYFGDMERLAYICTERVCLCQRHTLSLNYGIAPERKSGDQLTSQSVVRSFILMRFCEFH